MQIMVLENYRFFRSTLSAIWEVCLYWKRKRVWSWQALHSLCTERWRHLTCFCLDCVYARNRRRKWYKRAILQGILNLYINSTSLHFNNWEQIFMCVKNHKKKSKSVDNRHRKCNSINRVYGYWFTVTMPCEMEIFNF